MSKTEYVYDKDYKPTDEMKAAFDDKGYVIIRGLLNAEEVEKVTHVIETSDVIQEHSYSLDDGKERLTKVVAWKHPGNDVTGMVTRSNRVVKTCEKLLGGEVFHYHSKVNMKDAETGGRFVWHQDYGYWYQNGILKPDMMSVFFALDPSLQENGCLQVIEGSHKCGRIDHGFVGGQTGADIKRVKAIKDALPLRYVELYPGDAVFFHCNVLHTSNANTSARRRWVFISCYNCVSNACPRPHHFPSNGKIDIVSDESILGCSSPTDMSSKDFLDPKDNTLIRNAK